MDTLVNELTDNVAALFLTHSNNYESYSQAFWDAYSLWDVDHDTFYMLLEH